MDIIDEDNLLVFKTEPEVQDEGNNMGIARFEHRHAPSLDNLFSNKDGKWLLELI